MARRQDGTSLNDWSGWASTFAAIPQGPPLQPGAVGGSSLILGENESFDDFLARIRIQAFQNLENIETRAAAATEMKPWQSNVQGGVMHIALPKCIDAQGIIGNTILALGTNLGNIVHFDLVQSDYSEPELGRLLTSQALGIYMGIKSPPRTLVRPSEPTDTMIWALWMRAAQAAVNAKLFPGVTGTAIINQLLGDDRSGTTYTDKFFTSLSAIESMRNASATLQKLLTFWVPIASTKVGDILKTIKIPWNLVERQAFTRRQVRVPRSKKFTWRMEYPPRPSKSAFLGQKEKALWAKFFSAPYDRMTESRKAWMELDSTEQHAEFSNYAAILKECKMQMLANFQTITPRYGHRKATINYYFNLWKLKVKKNEMVTLGSRTAAFIKDKRVKDINNDAKFTFCPAYVVDTFDGQLSDVEGGSWEQIILRLSQVNLPDKRYKVFLDLFRLWVTTFNPDLTLSLQHCHHAMTVRTQNMFDPLSVKTEGDDEDRGS